jgi:hypothetical protein
MLYFPKFSILCQNHNCSLVNAFENQNLEMLPNLNGGRQLQLSTLRISAETISETELLRKFYAVPGRRWPLLYRPEQSEVDR